MTNPNPVAPKTDTPATQIPRPRPKNSGGIYYYDWREMDAYIANLESTLAAERQQKVRIAENLANAEDAFTEVSDTLAAERASRVQADTEQFNAGWINCRDYSAGQLREVASRLEQAYPDHSPQADTAYTIYKCADAIAESKPSVSPEQAEEN